MMEPTETWKCHICGDERPDEKISVLSKPIIINGQVIPGSKQNIRYCNDRPACIEGAKNFSFLKTIDGKDGVFVSTDKAILQGGVLSNTDKEILKSVETGEDGVAIGSVEQLQEIAEQFDERFEEFKKLCSKMTLKQARIVRMFRVEKVYSYRHIAEACYRFGWGKWEPPSNQLMGMALCWRAAQFFSEKYKEPPWN